MKEENMQAGKECGEAEWKGESEEPERFSGAGATNRADLESLKISLEEPF